MAANSSWRNDSDALVRIDKLCQERPQRRADLSCVVFSSRRVSRLPPAQVGLFAVEVDICKIDPVEVVAVFQGANRGDVIDRLFRRIVLQRACRRIARAGEEVYSELRERDVDLGAE